MNEQAAEVLKHIADKIDVPVQQLWAGLVAYAPFTYYQWLTGLVLSVFFFLASVAVIWWSLSKADSKENEGFFGVALIAFFCAIPSVMLLGMAGIGGMSDALAAKHAPEAWASKYIIRRVAQ